MKAAILSIFFLMMGGQAIAENFTLLPDEDPGGNKSSDFCKVD